MGLILLNPKALKTDLSLHDIKSLYMTLAFHAEALPCSGYSSETTLL